MIEIDIKSVHRKRPIVRDLDMNEHEAKGNWHAYLGKSSTYSENEPFA